MRKTKIVHILHSVGGVDVWLRLTLSNIDDEKFENIIIHGNSDTNTPFLDRNQKQLKDYKVAIIREISLLNDLKAIISIYKILKKEKPQLIHVHSAKAGILGRLVARILNIPVLFTPHAFSYLSEPDGLKKQVFLWIEKMFANRNSKLLAISDSERTRGIREAGYKEKNALVFPNCIDPVTITQNLTIDKTWPDNYICTVGRPCYQKNILEMINVVCELNKTMHVHLVLMGVGHHSDQLDMVKKLISDLNMTNNVSLINWMPREDVLHIIGKSQLYISTSRYEGLPYSIIESLSLGIPCVVSNCDGNRDLITDNFNGYVIKDNNTLEFSLKVVTILNDKIIHNKFSDNAKETFRKYYNIKENIKELEAIYLKNRKNHK